VISPGGIQQHEQTSGIILEINSPNPTNNRIVIKDKNKIGSSRSITLMVIFQCILYTLGMFPYLIANILSYILQSTSELTLFTNISYGFLYVSHGSTLFIYLTFNKQFRQVLFGYLQYIYFRL
jgi:hypothetical protein